MRTKENFNFSTPLEFLIKKMTQNRRKKSNKTRRGPPRSQPAVVVTGNTAGVRSSVSRGAVPLTYRSTLRYVETIAFTTGAAGVMGSEQTMLLNSLFDPNFTGTGHQPNGFDQLAALYNKYYVESCTITLLWSTIGSTADICCANSVQPLSSFTIAGITTDNATENNLVNTCVLSASGNSRTARTTIKVNFPKLLGLSREQYISDDRYQALVTASPTLGPAITIAIGSYSGVASEAATCQVILDMHATFFARKNLAQS
jgi:hypothetical protein